MARKRGSNKMTYRPLKNSNMIGAGKRESVQQIVDNGAKRPEGQSFKDYVKQQQEVTKNKSFTKQVGRTLNAPQKSQPVKSAPAKGR